MTSSNPTPGNARRLVFARRYVAWGVAAFVAVGAGVLLVFSPFRGSDELLNVSYDATRELFHEVDAAFSSAHPDLKVRTSHAGSGQQARNIIEGLEADVVTLATAADIDAIQEKTGLVSEGWREALPHAGSPFTSTIVFLVRSGNPKGVSNWEDLLRDNVRVAMPSPRVSGAGKWAYLAVWAHALRRSPDDEPSATRFVTSVYAKGRVLPQGARGALVTFLEGRDDVLLIWESEALHALEEHGPGKVAVVHPPVSIRAEPVVAVMDRTADKRGTTRAAETYLRFLFSPQGQELAARHHLRPRDAEVAAKFANRFPEVELLGIDEVFGGWEAAQEKHFGRSGTFARIEDFSRMSRDSL